MRDENPNAKRDTKRSDTKKIRFIVAIVPPVFHDKRNSKYQITRYATHEIYKMQLANK